VDLSLFYQQQSSSGKSGTHPIRSCLFLMLKLLCVAHHYLLLPPNITYSHALIMFVTLQDLGSYLETEAFIGINRTTGFRRKSWPIVLFG
jgi:hypothetical protein